MDRLTNSTPALPRVLARAMAGIALAIATTASFAAGADSPRDFLGDAIQDGRAEVEACQLALRTSANPAVQQFAKRMIADHEALNSRIEDLARRKGYKLPDGTTLEQHATYVALKPLTGSTFDKTFMKHNVSDHKDDIEKFDKQAQQGSDDDVRALASAALPTLREHLQLSEQTERAVSR